jgi:hypothetical protein
VIDQESAALFARLESDPPSRKPQCRPRRPLSEEHLPPLTTLGDRVCPSRHRPPRADHAVAVAIAHRESQSSRRKNLVQVADHRCRAAGARRPLTAYFVRARLHHASGESRSICWIPDVQNQSHRQACRRGTVTLLSAHSRKTAGGKTNDRSNERRPPLNAFPSPQARRREPDRDPPAGSMLAGRARAIRRRGLAVIRIVGTRRGRPFARR